ncbi:hypothetical protein LZ480_11455 [Solibacillus sp. MA9]|uniref:ATP-binding protein n=1 Tax=Solibacillus palustris TaxID=2908203 RepID=A0ABS9UEF6_9BACL|nr:hypothetical protein [Solibacillus sp. MA9]MCH7322509.1 hypothetical protein [Solibacillus sp. MA9]
MKNVVLLPNVINMEPPATLPYSIEKEYTRDSILRNISSNLNDKNTAIVLLGDKFSGKTTVLKQFYHQNIHRTGIYFVQNDSYKDRIDYILGDICKQLLPMCSVKVQEKISNNDLDYFNADRINDAFRKIYLDLCNKARKESSKYYIIFDGIDKLSPDVATELISLIPPGDFNGVYIIISFETNYPINLNFNYLPVTVFNFSAAETEYILKDIIYDKALINNIHEFCDGLPAYINELSIKAENDPDIIRKGFSEGIPKDFSEYTDSLWCKIEHRSNTYELDLLAILTFSKEKLKLNTLCDFLPVSIEDIYEMNSENDFIRLEDEYISIPNIYYEYLKHKLVERELFANEFLINFYEKQDLMDVKTISMLSDLYLENNNYSKLRDLMSIQTIQYNIQEFNDTQNINNSLKLLSKMSFREQDWATYQKATIITGILNEIKGTPPTLEHEIRTLLTLRKFDEAIKTTYMCSLNEDRAYLLSVICREYTKINEPVPNAIIQEINDYLDKTKLFTEFNKELIDKLTSISTNLFPADMNLSLDIIKKIVEKSSADISKEKLLDYMLLKLFLKLGDEISEESGIEEITTSIDNSEIKNYLNFITTSSIESFDHVKERILQITDTSAKMFYLINWSINHKNNEQILEAIEFTLDLFINNIDHSLSIRDLRILIESLIENIDNNDKEHVKIILVKAKDAKEKLTVGIKKENIKFSIIVSKIETYINKSSAQNQFLELINYVNSIEELDTKCLGLVILLQETLNILGEENIEYYNMLKNDFNSSFNKLIINAADHYSITSEIFYELSKCELNLTFIYFNKINTEKNRFRIYQHILKGIVETNQFKLEHLIKIFQLFRDPGNQDFLVFRLLQTLQEDEYILSRDEISRLKSVVLKIKLTQSKVISFSMLYNLSRNFLDLQEEIYDQMNIAIENLSVHQDRNKILYYIIKNISTDSVEKANKIYDTLLAQDSSIFTDSRLSVMHTHFISILIKMIPELTKNQQLEFYIKSILSHIEKANFIVDKAMLLNELGIMLIKTNKHELLNLFAKKYFDIFTNYSENTAILFDLMRENSVLLYFKNENLYFELLEKVTYREYKETSILNNIIYLSSKKLATDINDLESLAVHINFETAKKIETLIGHLKIDSNISLALNIFAQVLENSITRSEYSIREVEISNFYNSLINQIAEIFPDSVNIQHNGYLILSKARFSKFRGLRLKNEGVRKKLPIPNELFNEAKSINNIADRIFVYTYIAKFCYREDSNLSELILSEAEKELEKILNYTDKIDRAELIAETYYQLGLNNSARQAIMKILEMLHYQKITKGDYNNKDLENLIELSHKIHPEFAQSLSKGFDSPNEKIEIKRTLQTMNFHSTPSKIKEAKNVTGPSLKAFYIKTLKSLNSGRGHLYDETLIMETLNTLKVLELDIIFLALEWYIENINKSRAETNGVSKLNDQFSIIQHILDFIIGMDAYIVNNGNKNASVNNLYSLYDDKQIKHIRYGEGNEALRYLIEWINNNAKESLTIFEPYFSLDELHIFLKIFLKDNITIISAAKDEPKEEIQNAYINKWKELSNQAPPSISFITLSAPNAKTPMHDRYIIGDELSLELGTSINGFNTNDFKIKEVDSSETQNTLQNTIMPYLLNPPRIFEGNTIKIYKFQID